MPRRMACSLTVGAVVDRTKTVTRRHVDSWQTLKAGDRLTLIEKGMGLPKGAKQRVLAEVVVVSNRVEVLGMIAAPGELAAEGFPNSTAAEFRSIWAVAHGFGALGLDALAGIRCRRIEWRYL